MKKNLDMTKPRHSEKNLASPLARPSLYRDSTVVSNVCAHTVQS